MTVALPSLPAPQALAKGLRLRNARAGGDAEGAGSATPNATSFLPTRQRSPQPSAGRVAAHAPQKSTRVARLTRTTWASGRTHRATHRAARADARGFGHAGLWTRVFLYRVAGGAHDIYN